LATRIVQPEREKHDAIIELVQALHGGSISSRGELEGLKRAVATKYRLSSYPSNSEILAELSDDERTRWRDLACVNPKRSGSGIVVVTAFSAPFVCPHGTCTFCPGGPSIGTPQSYVLDGPSMKGAIAAGFDPRMQVRNNLRKYRENGHDTSKVEMIIEGGTFIALPLQYQEEFVKGAYDGLNGAVSPSLEVSHKNNEFSESRCVGLTIESKPDWCEPSHIDLMLSYGVTRLEIGVQSLTDEALKASNRGHTVGDTIRAFKTAKDSGLKVCAHMMPGLPQSTPESDAQDLRCLFEDETLRPDMMKIYPTLVVKGTALARLYELGRYDPYDLETVVEILAEMKQNIPKWHRIMRIQREIPEKDIVGGVKAGNLRELVLKRVAEKGSSCNCIRCREVALADPEDLLNEDELELNTEEYDASGGVEVFCSYEFRRLGKIAGFVRMRYPSEDAHRREVRGSCVIRELKVYGRAVGIGLRDSTAWQHRGLGASLLGEMETVARERFGCRKVLVTSAVGTRGYYRRYGYESLGPYMAKRL
jgi:elongator complex protein 3